MKALPLQKIAKSKLWKFFGGVKPKEMKDTAKCAIQNTKLPNLICLPIERHLGKDGELMVMVGDHVKRGQQLTLPHNKRLVPCHASTSGTITAISQEILPHPSGIKGLCITIKPDGLDEAIDAAPMVNWEHATKEELLDRMHNFGVEGLGGAQFQTDLKLRSCLEESKSGVCNVLIINGCECEPALTCDDRIMQERATEIALGIKIFKKILNPKYTFVAIEDNKPQAIKAMELACKDIATVRVLPTVYPSGSARNLIKILTGLEIPYNVHTSEYGIVVDNVGTVLASKEAIVDGVPLTSRVITMAGDALQEPANFNVRLGTSVRFLLTQCKLKPEMRQRIIMGGPMMGFTLPSIDVPVTKSTSCIFTPTTDAVPRIKEQTNCIRCGRCARVCPSRLVPYQMYNQSVAHNHAAAQKCGIKDCTLCGSCSFVCPSYIPLTHQFRYEKAVEKHILDAEKRNQRAKLRKEEKIARLEAEAKERAAKKEAALARMKAQKEAEAKMSPEELAAARQKALAEAKEKARLRKEALLKGKTLEGTVNDTSKVATADSNAPKAKTTEHVETEAEKVKRLKETERRAIEVTKHQGHLDNPMFKDKEEQVVVQKTEEQLNALPYALRAQAGVRDDYLVIKTTPLVEETNKVLELVGLEPDDKLQNPAPKKVIAQVLMSYQEQKKENTTLPQALKKKTLRARK